jgi:VIT family
MALTSGDNLHIIPVHGAARDLLRTDRVEHEIGERSYCGTRYNAPRLLCVERSALKIEPMGIDSMSEVSDIPFGRVLDPMERISETLFGLIMALTFICSLGVATAGNIKIQTMLIGALGCNLAWGIVDGGLYLLARINDQGRNILTLRALRQAPDPETARRVIANALPPELASVLPPEQLELMRHELQQLPEPSERPRLTRRDWGGALGLCLLSFLSTFPVVIPFIFLSDATFALRVSYAVAIVMLFCCGYAFGYHSGLRPWAAGLSMVVVGSALVSIAVALGG